MTDNDKKGRMRLLTLYFFASLTAVGVVLTATAIIVFFGWLIIQMVTSV